MGIDISKLVEPAPLRLEDLSGRALAIDAFNTLYQFIATIRQPDGTPLRDRDGRVTSHLSGLFHRTAALLDIGVRPAYVFDGEPPELKEKTLKARRAVKEAAEVEWKAALEAGDLKRALSKAAQTSRLDDAMVAEAKSLLDAMGIPWLVAPSEGEAQMAHMAIRGDVWAGASQDYDALLFGTPTLVRNLTLARKRRVSGGRSVDVSPELIDLDAMLSSLSLSRPQLVDLAILMGTDFNEGVRGIGPKRALKLIRKHGAIENVLADGGVSLPEDFGEVRRLFLEPQVTDGYALTWRAPVPEDVRRLLCDSHGFSVDRVDATLSKVCSMRACTSQSSIDSW
ncbi:MAG: flap endonuclease-1 [Methanobacteriota archaeon]|nr:MAG: flap endonuclease-1 [Euryarchaeota archaeon]